MGANFLIYLFVIFIEELHIPLSHQGLLNSIQVNGHIGQEFKFKELTILILLVLYAQGQVLRTDAMASLNI